MLAEVSSRPTLKIPSQQLPCAGRSVQHARGPAVPPGGAGLHAAQQRLQALHAATPLRLQNLRAEASWNRSATGSRSRSGDVEHSLILNSCDSHEGKGQLFPQGALACMLPSSNSKACVQQNIA